MAVRVTKNFSFRRVAFSDRRLMRQIGLLVRERIIRRTISGRTTEGGAMQAYTPQYAARKAKELGSSNVNLQVSGQMLNAITITDVDDDSVELGFRD